jgi:hypothetical protein
MDLLLSYLFFNKEILKQKEGNHENDYLLFLFI